MDVQLADQRIAVATNLEAEGFFHGAHNEFRLAGLLDPGVVEEIIEGAKVEVKR